MMHGQVTRYAYRQTWEAVSEVMLWEYNKSQICSCKVYTIGYYLNIDHWNVRWVYHCLQKPMYIFITTLHSQLCHPLSTCKQSPEVFEAKHPISVSADCGDCELRNIITFPLPTLFSAYVLNIICRCIWCIVGMAFIQASIEVWYMCGVQYTLPHPPPHQIWCGTAIATSPSPHHKTWTYYGVENL